MRFLSVASAWGLSGAETHPSHRDALAAVRRTGEEAADGRARGGGRPGSQGCGRRGEGRLGRGAAPPASLPRRQSRQFKWYGAH